MPRREIQHLLHIDDRAQEDAYRLSSEGDTRGDSPLWQGEESYISDVQVSSQEGAKRKVAEASPHKLNIKSG